ncbi:hypothetical protein CC2G_004546 [Coprinopsis cinerea AmutBmut pab1-1]|nr:hypothetical protein CC2G_004546 [Coprinopsis cinerea AmutBmut pab1-1]
MRRYRYGGSGYEGLCGIFVRTLLRLLRFLLVAAQAVADAIYSLQFMKGTFSELWIELRKKVRTYIGDHDERTLVQLTELASCLPEAEMAQIDTCGCAALAEHAWIETKGPPGRVIDLGTLVHS